MATLRYLPLVLLLAACGTTNYSNTDDVKETCRDLGLEGAAYDRCVERREREAACRQFVNSREYTAAEARRRGCQAM
jgi:hypothetical protein